MQILSANNLAQASPSDIKPNTGLTNNGKPVVISTPAIEVTEQPATSGQLQNAADSINKAMQQSNKSLEFTVDTSTKKSVVKLIDSETGDTIRQFPSEEMLAISRSIDQFQKGLLLKQEA